MVGSLLKWCWCSCQALQQSVPCYGDVCGDQLQCHITRAWLLPPQEFRSLLYLGAILREREVSLSGHVLWIGVKLDPKYFEWCWSWAQAQSKLKHLTWKWKRKRECVYKRQLWKNTRQQVILLIFLSSFYLHITWYLWGISLLLGAASTTPNQRTIIRECKNPLKHEFKFFLWLQCLFCKWLG